MDDAICTVEDAQSIIHPVQNSDNRAQNSVDDAICTVDDAQSILHLAFYSVDGAIYIIHPVLSSIVPVRHHLGPPPTDVAVPLPDRKWQTPTSRRR